MIGEKKLVNLQIGDINIVDDGSIGLSMWINNERKVWFNPAGEVKLMRWIALKLGFEVASKEDKGGCMNADDKYWMRRAMTIYGGSFAKALGEAWAYADDINSAKLSAAFPELVEKYAKMGKILKWAKY